MSHSFTDLKIEDHSFTFSEFHRTATYTCTMNALRDNTPASVRLKFNIDLDKMKLISWEEAGILRENVWFVLERVYYPIFKDFALANIDIGMIIQMYCQYTTDQYNNLIDEAQLRLDQLKKDREAYTKFLM